VRPASIVATADHNTPTKDWHAGIADRSRAQVETLDANMKANGAKAYFPFGIDARASSRDRAEQGATSRMTVVCGDSHQQAGAFAALAFASAPPEVEHVPTQCLLTKLKSLQIKVEGRLHDGVTAGRHWR
jgi:3-isopropylmalate/(R)-2-methylmalate dehydratase large subunit